MEGAVLEDVRRKSRDRSSQKVNHHATPASRAELTSVVPEAEDLDIGEANDLAADVDDGEEAVSDPEGLDSSDDEELGDLDMIDEQSEGKPCAATLKTQGAVTDESVPMHVLPLYSLLPNDQQMLVFKPPPENHRLVIISTNVAETSLTIPGIRYVVDSGRAKERSYDPQSGVQAFSVSWISKASASQRTGRAGRTGPGHCYRLYSSALFENHFEKFSKPEILRMPIESVVLNMKAMNIDQVTNFPFPTPPDRYTLKKAEDLLTHLGALERGTTTKMVGGTQQTGAVGGRITDLGKKMGGYPVSPRFAKMLVVGEQNGCLPYVIAIVACLSVGDPFIHEQALEVDNEEDETAQSRYIRSDDIREKEERKETRKRFFSAQQVSSGIVRFSCERQIVDILLRSSRPSGLDPAISSRCFLQSELTNTTPLFNSARSTFYAQKRCKRSNSFVDRSPPSPKSIWATSLLQTRQRYVLDHSTVSPCCQLRRL